MEVDILGAVAQMGERCLRKAEPRVQIPPSPLRALKPLLLFMHFRWFF